MEAAAFTAPPGFSLVTAPEPDEEPNRRPDGTMLPGHSANPDDTETRSRKAKVSYLMGEAIKKILGMSLFEFNSFQPKTVAEQKALELVSNLSLDSLKIILDRTEGRAVQKVELNSTHKDVNERVGDIARKRLNEAAIAAAGGAVPEEADVLEVPGDGAAGAEGPHGEPPVAGQAAG